MAGFSREVARRIFAEELKSSNYSFREGEDQHQYAPQYLLTPTGAKCNRVFFVGTLTEKDDIGTDVEYWRGRVVDPTGSILIYAGQYQPEAAQILASMDAPAFVSIVGKPNLYQTEDGNVIISLRAESIQRVDEATRNQWIMDTARRTLERLSLLEKAEPAPLSSDFTTADSAYPSTNQQDAARAREHYHTDIERYRKMVTRALASLKADLGKTVGDDSGSLASSAGSERMGEENGDELHEPIEEGFEAKPEAKQKEMPEEKQPNKKIKPKKGGSLDSWPEAGGDEEVETFNLGKKS
ncbi:RPA family protein [Methanothrix soehngenii]